MTGSANYHGESVIVIRTKAIHDMATGEVTGTDALVRFQGGEERWIPLHLLSDVKRPAAGSSKYWTAAGN